MGIGTLYDQLAEVSLIALDLLSLLLNLTPERYSKAFLFDLFTDALRNLKNGSGFARPGLAEAQDASFPQLTEVQGTIP